MNKDLEYIVKHVSHWPAEADTVRLDADGEVCFRGIKGLSALRYDFYPDGKYPTEPQGRHPCFTEGRGVVGSVVGTEYSICEWHRAIQQWLREGKL